MEYYGSDAYQPGPGSFTADSTVLQTQVNPIDGGLGLLAAAGSVRYDRLRTADLVTREFIPGMRRIQINKVPSGTANSRLLNRYMGNQTVKSSLNCIEGHVISPLRFTPVEMTFKGQENREKSPYLLVNVLTPFIHNSAHPQNGRADFPDQTGHPLFGSEQIPSQTACQTAVFPQD